jgi:hypothetical protein
MEDGVFVFSFHYLSMEGGVLRRPDCILFIKKRHGGRVCFDTEKNGGLRATSPGSVPVRGAAVLTPAGIRKELETG